MLLRVYVYFSLRYIFWACITCLNCQAIVAIHVVWIAKNCLKYGGRVKKTRSTSIRRFNISTLIRLVLFTSRVWLLIYISRSLPYALVPRTLYVGEGVFQYMKCHSRKWQLHLNMKRFPLSYYRLVCMSIFPFVLSSLYFSLGNKVWKVWNAITP